MRLSKRAALLSLMVMVLVDMIPSSRVVELKGFVVEEGSVKEDGNHSEVANILEEASESKDATKIKEISELKVKDGSKTQNDDTESKSFEMESVEIYAEMNSSEHMKVGDVRSFEVTLTYFTKKLTLQMEENQVTVQGGVKLISYTENGTRIVSDGETENCRFYQGYVVNEPDSNAAVSICDGELEGAILTEDQRYVLKPRHGASKAVSTGANGRFLFGPHSLTVHPIVREYNNKYGYVRIPCNNTAKPRARRDTALHLSETKYVELYIVNDRSEFIWLGSNTANNMRRMKQITNLMDSFYQPHNVRVIFRALEVWNHADRITVNVNIETTLHSFLSYRRYTIMPNFYHDNAQLVSRIDFTGPTIGVAPLNGMCRIEHSGNINQDTHSHFAHVAATMVHEMGHNLGMYHDEWGCACYGRHGVCLMSPYAEDPIPTKFSECSKKHLVNFLTQQLGGCLMNKPDTGIYHDEKLCGNNKLDPGEDCDCGYPAFCQNPCCNAHTCKFTPGSQCYTGACCSHCKLKAEGAKCRDTLDPCDIAETCDGVSGECGQNFYHRNGHPCNEFGQTGYCYDGYCRTYNGQCRRVWGGNAIGADPSCYSVLNPRGDQHGNCGVSGNYYVRCSHANINCGKLFCIHLPHGGFPIIGYGKARSRVSFIKGFRRIYCYSGRASLGQNQANPFLISDGVQCAHGLACLHQRCVPVSHIMSNPCPENCNGHGVCTQQGICLCEKDRLPPACHAKTTPKPTTTRPPTTTPTTTNPTTTSPTTTSPTTTSPTTTSLPTTSPTQASSTTASNTNRNGYQNTTTSMTLANSYVSMGYTNSTSAENKLTCSILAVLACYGSVVLVFM